MKILFVLNQLGVGGIQRKAALLATGLIERGHQVDVATFFGRGAFAEPIEQAGGRVLPLGESANYGATTLPSRMRFAAQRLWRLRTLVQSGKYDVVYGLGPTAGVYASLASGVRGPNVAWGIELLPATTAELPRYAPLLARRVDLVIAASSDVREACLAHGFPLDRTVVIDNGVDFDRFAIRPDWREEVRRSIGVHDDEFLIGYIGRIQAVKNVAVLLEAFSIIGHHVPRARLAIIGPGDARYVDEMKNLSIRMGIDERIDWIGPVHNPERFFNALDVYVSTSDLEGFQLTRIEAMACGTSCVVTDTADAGKILGEYGRVVPLRDPVAVADAVSATLRNEEGWTPESIRASVIDRYSATRQVERTETALQGVLSSRRGAA